MGPIVKALAAAVPHPALRVYLSGPMTGLPDLNFPAFNAAAAMLRECGFKVINPAEINIDPAADWHACMKADIKALCDCDMLALLPGWENSTGAHLEVHIAHRLRIRVTHVAQLAEAAAALGLQA